MVSGFRFVTHLVQPVVTGESDEAIRERRGRTALAKRLGRFCVGRVAVAL
jgi:hypothetical protein